ncbi:hypothetical protein F4677DRAFT_415137 [Hypoxylon crocopeplum]|nr:hypothetical protein F4677DRAFT_415137 [Hypoxylon crocopeplum]
MYLSIVPLTVGTWLDLSSCLLLASLRLRQRDMCECWGPTTSDRNIPTRYVCAGIASRTKGPLVDSCLRHTAQRVRLQTRIFAATAVCCATEMR